jgi:glutamate racemase
VTISAAVDPPLLPVQKPNKSIGVFDSGVGGLSVLQRIRVELPHETLLYVADSSHAPYGNKPVEFIVRRSFAITEFLLERGAKAIVVACNTATAAAIAPLRARFDIPIIGIEPALKPAVATTRTGVVGILATGNTVASDKFANLLDRHGHQARVLVQPCPGLADCVENGDLRGPRPQALLVRYLQPLLEQNADTLVLGCTHYPFLIPVIQSLAGPNVMILDPGPAVARQLRHRLAAEELIDSGGVAGSEYYFTSGTPEPTARVMSQLLKHPVTPAMLPEQFRSEEALIAEGGG